MSAHETNDQNGQSSSTHKLTKNMNSISNIRSSDSEINKTTHNVVISRGILNRCTISRMQLQEGMKTVQKVSSFRMCFQKQKSVGFFSKCFRFGNELGIFFLRDRNEFGKATIRRKQESVGECFRTSFSASETNYFSHTAD